MTAGRADIARALALLVENELLPPDELARRCERLLDAQLSHVAAASRFHRDRMAAVEPRRAGEEASSFVRRLPTMDKQTLLDHFDSICARPAIRFDEVAAYLRDRSKVDEPFPVPGHMAVSTAGTTGKAGYFVYSTDEQAHVRAQYLRFMRAVLSSFEITEPLRTSAIIMTKTHMIGYKMMRGLPPEYVQIIPVMDEGRPVTVVEMARKLEEFRPHVLTCFGTTLRMLVEHKIAEPRFRFTPRAVISTGATLDPDVRRRAEAVFPDLRVFDLYGSTDTGYLAWTCERGAMHLNVDCALVEVLGDDGAPRAAGESGQIHLTTFWHRTLPILRYRLGDVVTLGAGTCACGRSLPLLERVLGRENTLLYAKRAARPEPISQGFIVELFESIAGVRRFRLVQKSFTEIDIDVVPNGGDAPPTVEIAERLRAVFGSETAVRVRVVDAIAPHPVSGKTAPVERWFTV